MVQHLSFDDGYGNLVRECLKGSRLAQKELYGRLSSRMFSVCIRYVGDREIAKDVLHDGFIVLFSKLDTFKWEGSFEGWARRIFVNTALMTMRKGDVLKYSEGLDSKEAGMITIAPAAVSELEAQTLMNLISQMPAGFRTVFNMYAIEGYSHQEIAKELDITEGGSRSQLSRARLWLQEKLYAMGIK
jgi:RNA polymerase sigma-70 factor (ECF subfamily)